MEAAAPLSFSRLQVELFNYIADARGFSCCRSPLCSQFPSPSSCEGDPDSCSCPCSDATRCENDTLDSFEIRTLRSEILINPSVLEDFVNDRSAGDEVQLHPEQRATIRSWSRAVEGVFYCVQHSTTDGFSVLVDESGTRFAVWGLDSTVQQALHAKGFGELDKVCIRACLMPQVLWRVGEKSLEAIIFDGHIDVTPPMLDPVAGRLASALLKSGFIRRTYEEEGSGRGNGAGNRTFYDFGQLEVAAAYKGEAWQGKGRAFFTDLDGVDEWRRVEARLGIMESFLDSQLVESARRRETTVNT